MPGIATVVIDRNNLFRQGLRALLVGSEYEIVGEAAGPLDAAADAGSGTSVELVLCDVAPGASVAQTVTLVRSTFQGARLVMLMGELDAETMMSALQSGVDGCLVKDISTEALAQSLRLVLMGEMVFPTELAALLVSGRLTGATPDASLRKGLSTREVEVLRRLVAGDSNKLIANRLGISEATIKVHLKSLLRKLGVSNRTQAAIWALNNMATSEDDVGDAAD
jgi:two-component system nitrate/nitrite response regulator NarL